MLRILKWRFQQFFQHGLAVVILRRVHEWLQEGAGLKLGSVDLLTCTVAVKFTVLYCSVAHTHTWQAVPGLALGCSRGQ